VAYGRVAPEPTVLASALAAGSEGAKAKTGSPAWTWAALMHRASRLMFWRVPIAGAGCG